MFNLNHSNIPNTINPYTTRAPTSNSTVRRFSKPIIFKAKASEDLIFKNLAASFKLRPSLNISNFSLLPTKGQKFNKKPIQRYQNKDFSEDFSRTSYTPVLKSSSKHPLSYRKKLRPMFNQHKVTDLNLEIEGRPCTRPHKYPCIDSFTSDYYEKPQDSIPVHIEIHEKF